ncbi:hypothetical protein P4B35_19620 [Pontiellaceae bacterium B12227]|nr:hypothetical protein [Pontiellaceae bacterium B12227]
MNQPGVSRRKHLKLNTAFLAGLLAARNGWVQAADGASFAGDLDSLKNSLVRISGDRLVGIGFIAEQDGRQYVFTNASVISGHNKLVIQTLDNKAVHPKKIELSATRDLVRLLVSEEKALKLNPEIVADEVIGVLDYFRGATQNHGGIITGSSKDMIEINVAFEKECSGSPLLDGQFGVRGIANHLVYYKANGPNWIGTPRTFGYKLDDAAWYSANWGKYNKTYGKSLREIDEFRNTVYAIAQKWIKRPKAEIEFEGGLSIDFDRWVKEYNNMISDLSKTKSKGSGASPNEKIQKRFKESCDELTRVCEAKARNLEFLCEDKTITKYLRIQFKWRALELKKFGRFVTAHAKLHDRDRWM